MSAATTLITTLGLTEDFLSSYLPPPQSEASEQDLKAIHQTDVLNPILATAKTASCWGKMQSAAAQDGINLYIISGFRSVQYQLEIVDRKRKAGQDMEQILKVSALPGYSEHHTGRALDLGMPGMPALTEEFEHSKGFNWLQKHAGTFAFSMSYPRQNRFGIAFEPWHWLCEA